MHSKLLGLSLVTGLMSATAFAEPAIQPGDSLESLSKVKVTTTVNGQVGSIQDLVTSGQIRIVDAGQVATQPTQVGSETQHVQTNSAADVNATQATDINTTAQAVEALPEQANSPAFEQTAQAASENVNSMQPNAELAAQQAEQVMDQETAAQAPVNETSENSAAAPVNTAETNEAFAAAPETAQPQDAVQAAPEAGINDAPVNASPEAPALEQTEN